ncbi:MAG: pilus assembly protein TadG-related protein [Clostridia bacterium]|nr:pilus assembly protein TadG-related protein [Clostridia bacterium]
MKNSILKTEYLKSSKGSSIVIFALTLTIIMVMAALVIDLGNAFLVKATITSAVDAAALAGAQELVTDYSNASNMAQNYVLKNESNLKSIVSTIDADKRGIEVKATKNVSYYFAKVIGFQSRDITAAAKARAENISSLKGVRPLAVVQQTFTYGKLYTLKEGGGGGTTGNYAPIELGGTGAQKYQDNLLNGYNGTINIGDVIYTETGNMAGPTHTVIQQLVSKSADTYDNYSIDCPRVIFLPVVNTLSVNGKKAIKVLGFATFFLEGVTIGSNGTADVVGRFITYCMDGQTSSTASDFGTYSIKLVR